MFFKCLRKKKGSPPESVQEIIDQVREEVAAFQDGVRKRRDVFSDAQAKFIN